MTEDKSANDSSTNEKAVDSNKPNIPSISSYGKKNKSLDYDKVSTVLPEEFALLLSNFRADRFTKSDVFDLKKIELMLDLRPGILNNEEFYLELHDCGNCGKRLEFSDFVYTAMKYGNHSRSFIVHTLLGNKLIRNEHRTISCTNCNTVSDKPLNYMTNGYGCCNLGNI
ncbi:hypothetical protein [Rhizobium ecuadorense]|uniref:hypothetical protein n=1 Tax=Rhizobium ecuadorense TaxID=1671795 RepID=UPI00128FBA28|nr:hypothetical protein [Rhizobium ecuadorense]